MNTDRRDKIQYLFDRTDAELVSNHRFHPDPSVFICVKNGLSLTSSRFFKVPDSRYSRSLSEKGRLGIFKRAEHTDSDVYDRLQDSSIPDSRYSTIQDSEALTNRLQERLSFFFHG